MRFAVKKQQSSSGHLKKDGTPDMRFVVNKERELRLDKSASGTRRKLTFRTSMSNDNSSISPRNTSTSSSNASLNSLCPLKTKGGTPDMRCSSNDESAYGSASSCSTNDTNNGSSSSSTSWHSEGSSDSTLSSSSHNTDASSPIKKDGTPDMRYSRNQSAYDFSSNSSYGGSSSSYLSYWGSSSSSSESDCMNWVVQNSGHLKSDGTPDMRYSCSEPIESSYSRSLSSSSSSSMEYSVGSTISYTPTLKSDGTPDKRCKANWR